MSSFDLADAASTTVFAVPALHGITDVEAGPVDPDEADESVVEEGHVGIAFEGETTYVIAGDPEDVRELLLQALAALDAAVPTRNGAPTARVERAEDDQRWLVMVDTDSATTGHVTVDLNDGRIFDGDPETFDAVTAAEKALALVEPDEGDWPTGEMVEAIIAATRGED